MDSGRVCKRCGLTLPLDRFREQGGYYLHTCKRCEVELNRLRRLSNPESARKWNEKQRRANRKLKQEVMVHYGGQCACCGEADDRFLTLDHRDGGGAEHRRSVKRGTGGSYFYRWVRDNGYPDYLQVLCFNCNCGRQVNGGTCPHQEGKT